MGYEIRHKRLYAFYNSRVLNVLMGIEVMMLCLMGYSGYMVVPGIVAGIILLGMIVYSAWLWIKKPAQIVIDKRLSDLSMYTTLFFIIVLVADPANRLWYLAPAACTLVILLLSFIKNDSATYETV